MSLNQITYPNTYPLCTSLSSLNLSQETPNPITGYSSAIISCQSTTSGFLQPVMTTTQKEAITSPATGLQVYDSTLQTPSWYNGSAWQNGGSQAVISRTVLESPTGTVSFSSIPQTFNNLKLLVSAQATGAVASLGVKFNSEATGPYQYQYLESSLGTSQSAYTGSTSGYLGLIPSNSSSYFGQGKYDILNYADTTKIKNMAGNTSYTANTIGAITSSSVALSSGNANNLSAISGVSFLTLSGASFQPGSTFEVIGYN